MSAILDSGHGDGVRESDASLLYILGYGHSGSTVLNIALGQHPDVFGAGELCLLSRAWQNGEYCSCGATIAECPTWSAVVARWRERCSIDPVTVQIELQRAMERLGPIFSPTARAGGSLVEDYNELMHNLACSVREVSGKRWVIDSSKRAERCLALARVPGIHLRAIHLIRDGRGVAWSLRRSLEIDVASGIQRAKHPQPASRTSLAWLAANIAAETVCRRLGGARSTRLRYEDFAGDPGGSVAALGVVMDLDFGVVAGKLRAGEPLDPGHVVAGNRVRMTGPVKLRFDHEWRSRLPVAQRRAAALVCWPLLSRYGYGGPAEK